MKHDEFFRKHPVFTGEELGKHLSSHGEVGGRAQEALLAYHQKAGRVVRVRRGLYAVIPAGADAGSYPVDPFLVAAKLTADAVLSHHTALEFHGRAYSVQEHFTYSASRPLSPLTFRSHVFRGTKFPQALLRVGKEHFGISTAERAGMELRVTSLERTVVDVLDRPDLSGSWEEIWRSLESVEFFDLDKVVEHALLLGNATTGAKVGFFLEQHREPLMVEDRHLKALHDLQPRQPHYLDRAKRKSGRLVSEWNLVVPGEVLERTWGEGPMKISPEKLAAEAEATGFRPGVLEKVAHLVGLLDAMRSHPFLKGRLVLKGGTALNLFVFDVPRLSVDIDLNYVGAEDRETMLAERPNIEQAIQAVFSREGFNVRRMPEEHAGGKWSLRYESTPGRTGNLEVDVNFMFRVPLWPVTTSDSHPVGAWRATGIRVLDHHELAAGKLAALLSRRQARDLFDSHRVLRMDDLDFHRLRIGFVVYGAMNRKDWRTVSAEDVDFEAAQLARQLIPKLRVNAVEVQTESAEYGARLVRECRKGLSEVLPFTDSERAFLDLLLDRGVIDPTILTADASLQRRIQGQPLLEWKALNVRRHKGLS